MPVFADHYRNARQNRDQSAPNNAVHAAAATASSKLPGPLAGNLSRPSRIYPREINNRHTKSPNLSNAASPLISALPNASFARSIPLPSFLSNSSPSSGAAGSLGSTSGGVGLGGAAASPPSGPASYSSSGFSAPRRGGYQGFEQHSVPNSGGFQNSYGQSSPVAAGARFSNGGHVQPGDNDFACELQTIDDPGVSGGGHHAKPGGSGGGDNVVCLGWDGGVDVWRIDKDKAESIGQLAGLKGGVKSAKILPNPPLNDPLAAKRPLICLTIHSPISAGASADHEAAIPLQGDSPYSDSPPERPGSSGSQSGFRQGNPELCDWQTTVEVWSLATKTRLATLFKSPPIPTADVGFGISAPPPVWGGLRVHVSATRVAVGVGSSGEIYVYDLVADKKSPQHLEWKCVEKLWTCVQFPNTSFSGESGGGGGGDGRNSSFGLPMIGVPVFALSDRWLAYCPAAPGSFSAGGEVCVPMVSPSVTAQSAPPQPALSAYLEGDDEPLMDRVKRGVAQGALHVGKRAADAGYKMLQNYLNRDQNSSSPPGQGSQPSAGNGYTHSNGSMTSLQSGMHQPASVLGQQIRQMQHQGNTPPYQQFYPPQNTREDRLVSIVDLQKLAGSPQPMATFLPSGGVSFLSFAPSGLALLTATAKGDVVTVWDLLKTVHTPSSVQSRSGSTPSSPDPSQSSTGPYARLIARFPRVTVATIVEVDWNAPRGDKIAVVTERGTVHFYDLPFGALQWPPYKPPPPTSAAINNSQTSAAGVAVSNAVSLFNSSTQPLLTAARRRHSRGSSLGGSPGGIFSLPSPTSVRKGSHSGTSPHSGTPTGSNRISLPPSAMGVQPGCVKFLTARERGYVAVVGGGKLQIYQLRPGGSGKRGSKTGGVAPKGMEYQLPYLPYSDESLMDLDDGKAEGFWNMRSARARDAAAADDNNGEYWKTPLAWAEIETNPVFVPWHQHRRVKMFHYTPEKYLKLTAATNIKMKPAPESSAPVKKAEKAAEVAGNTWKLEQDMTENASPQTDTPKPAPTPAPTEPPPPAPAPTPPTAAPVQAKGKKGKKSKGYKASAAVEASPSPIATPEPAATPVAVPSPASTPIPTPAPAPAILQTLSELTSPTSRPTTSSSSTSRSAPKKPEPWVFGLPIKAERVFITDAGGRGDVQFLAGDDAEALKDAMGDDGLASGLGVRVQEEVGMWGVDGIEEEEVGEFGVVVGR